MESIVEHQHKFLLQFDVMLQNFEKLSLSRHRFLKMLVLNVAVVDINLAKGNISQFYNKTMFSYIDIINYRKSSLHGF